MSFEIKNGVLKKYIAESEETEVVIPDTVTEIGNSAFEYCKTINSVIIPKSVTSIGSCAFLCCSNLKSVTIPDSVTEIGEEAFWGCSHLISVSIPDSVTSIGESAFSWCKNLTSVTIPDSVKIIREGTFLNCHRLKSITIPESVTEIVNNAFEECDSLESVTVKCVIFKADRTKFCKDFNNAVKLPETKEFSATLYTPLKTAVIVGFYLQSGDADAEVFIKKGITRIMKFLIDEDNVVPIHKLLETGKFVTAKNIKTFIDYANNLQKKEIQLIFMEYSHKHFNPVNKS